MFLTGSKVTFLEEYATQFPCYEVGHVFTIVPLRGVHRKLDMDAFRTLDDGEGNQFTAFTGALQAIEEAPAPRRQRVRQKAPEPAQEAAVLRRRRLKR